jgi:hypothetical protein
VELLAQRPEASLIFHDVLPVEPELPVTEKNFTESAEDGPVLSAC